ncbi:MAG: futalosine hydrolase [Acidobacteria bacterium]|nr:MAG: futalosine hydrolase [Acidobacteriota bacterium]
MNRLLVCATPLEAELLVQGFGGGFKKERVGTGVVFRSENGGRAPVLVTGVGKTNSALVLTQYFLNHGRPDEVINTGIAGAYPGNGIIISHVAVATEEIYADEGVQTTDAFLTMEDIGFPLLITDDAHFYHRFPVPHGKSVQEMLVKKTKLSVYEGRFLTVSTCAATREIETERTARFQPICESMEGAAVAHTCAAFGVKFTEIRGISNFVGSYEKEGWQIENAMQFAAGCTYAYLEG